MLREPLALEKCASGLLTLQNLLPRNSELRLADTQTLACAICPSHSACLSNLLPLVLQVAPSSLWYQISRVQFLRLQNNLEKHSVLFHRAHTPGQPAHCSWGSPPALPLAWQLLYSPAVPWSPWQGALSAAQDGVTIPLCSVNKTPVQCLALVLLSPLQASSSALSLSR